MVVRLGEHEGSTRVGERSGFAMGYGRRFKTGAKTGGRFFQFSKGVEPRGLVVLGTVGSRTHYIISSGGAADT